MSLSRTVISRSVRATHAFARRLLAELEADRGTEAGIVLALHGELGSGKTCFVQGLAKALDVTQGVTSPTFTLVNEYAGRRPLVHVDLYRVNGSESVGALGLEEYFDGPGVLALEWGEKAGALLPPDTVHVYFEALGIGGTHRKISIGCASPTAGLHPIAQVRPIA
ncbi:MAG: tRNA (adenosine(37)-N6)-threonylcarbamoyltransferase complex ATPase subunit type 1 TsaE [Lentisphaerae bacterium]|nr:tRNA (adenosine(37)-N6)-threonylcarbamoyltransferase complex ATPase subunit type 1 TsaE [Lentisphaerota bacterium]